MNPAFLEPSEIIDWQSRSIRQLADELRQQADGELDVAQRTFEWVRDNILHSLDYQRTEVTCRASDVLSIRTGYCYAKSHLLAALLRANGIPAGFCYQRLTLDGDKPPHCLHGLNAVYLKDHGWYRIDARGNKVGVDAQFTPPQEQLAFSTLHDGEYDFSEIWPEPLPIIVQSLENASSVQALAACLPDVPIKEMLAMGKSTVTTQPSVTIRGLPMSDEPKKIKQVIVVRHDLKMRRGKQIAQGAHASMSFICRRLQERGSVSLDDFSEVERAWLTGAFAKVCCRVDSEEELMTIQEKAVEAGLEVHLITDSGKTEFHGVPTRTCLAIGPDDAQKIDAITGQLQLL